VDLDSPALINWTRPMAEIRQFTPDVEGFLKSALYVAVNEGEHPRVSDSAAFRSRLVL
jgi:hypothetical protein